MLNINSRYVANPKKVLRQLLLGGKYPEVTKGKIVAGDAVELDVLDNLSIEGNIEKKGFSYINHYFIKSVLILINLILHYCYQSNFRSAKTKTETETWTENL